MYLSNGDKMSISRRKFMKSLASGTAYITMLAALPNLVWAKWNKAAFESDNYEKALATKYPGMDIVDSTAVTLKAPEIAENGSVVSVTVKTKLPDVKSISLFVKNNPTPLSACFNLGEGMVANVKVRIRFGETSELVAIVEAGGKLHRVQQLVKVTIGGCGG